MQIKLTKAKRNLYLMNKDAVSKVYFKFLDAHLLVNRVGLTPIIYWHTTRLYRQGDSRNIT
jgi:CDP-glycerol glycerophosphotransferase (TagB/SpsB family)